MALQTTALDRMFEQTGPRRRGSKEPRLPHGLATKRGDTTLTGSRSLVRGNAHDLLGRRSRYASRRIAMLAGRVNY